MSPVVPLAEAVELLATPFAAERWSTARGEPLLVVDLAEGGPGAETAAVGLANLACVVVGVLPEQPGEEALLAARWVDTVVGGRPAGPGVTLADPDSALAAVRAGVEANPMAATSLALLLRGSEDRSVADGLAAESAVYSLLQAGPEFEAWRAGRARKAQPRPSAGGGAPTVRVRREDATLRITLARPGVHNAVDAAVQEQLVEALTLAAVDPGIERVVLDGDGPSFSSGGDLDEFGSFPDPATAHLVRLARSPARLLAGLAERVEVRLHGTCLGAGIELAAFAGRVVAHPATVAGLPEVALGLVPGAGGTVSLPRRIGRQRTAFLALSGRRIDAETARAWGLVDEVAEGPAG